MDSIKAWVDENQWEEGMEVRASVGSGHLRDSLSTVELPRRRTG